MFVKIVSLLLLVGVAVARDLTGVDPNSLQCDPKGQIHLLLPSFTDCNKFYTCDNGREVQQSCPASLIFDFELQTCNWAWAVECKLRKSPQEDSSEEDPSEKDSSEKDSSEKDSFEEEDLVEGSGASGEGSGDFEWVDSAHYGQLELSPVAEKLLEWRDKLEEKVSGSTFSSRVLDCSSPISATRQVAYQGDCQRFWRCDGGLPHTFYCSDGLFFNEKTMQCDFEANVRCVVNQEEELGGEFLMYK